MPDGSPRPGGFLWCGGATAGGFLPVADARPVVDDVLALVSEGLRSARNSGTPADDAAGSLAQELGATREPSITTMEGLRARIATLAPRDVPSVDLIAAALAAWVHADPSHTSKRLQAARVEAAHDRDAGPHLSGVGQPEVLAIGLRLDLPSDQVVLAALDGMGAATDRVDAVAAAATAGLLRELVGGRDVRGALRAVSSVLHRLDEPAALEVDARMRRGAAARGADDVAGPVGPSVADQFAVVVAALVAHPSSVERWVALDVAAQAGRTARDLATVVLAARHGGPEGDTPVSAEVDAVARALARATDDGPRSRRPQSRGGSGGSGRSSSASTTPSGPMRIGPVPRGSASPWKTGTVVDPQRSSSAANHAG